MYNFFRFRRAVQGRLESHKKLARRFDVIVGNRLRSGCFSRCHAGVPQLLQLCRTGSGPDLFRQQLGYMASDHPGTFRIRLFINTLRSHLTFIPYKY
jgi:hypothetical protein